MPGNDKVVQVRITADRYCTSEATEWMCCSFSESTRATQPWQTQSDIGTKWHQVFLVRTTNLSLDLLKSMVLLHYCENLFSSAHLINVLRLVALAVKVMSR